MSQIPSFREILLPNRVDPRSSRQQNQKNKKQPPHEVEAVFDGVAEEQTVADSPTSKPPISEGHLDLTA